MSILQSRKIYFLCPVVSVPTGGIKQIFRQAEILANNGYNVSILQKRLTAPTWFKNTVRIEEDRYLFKSLKYLVAQEHNSKKMARKKRIKLWYLKLIRKPLEVNSILVFPEIYGDFITKIEPSKQKVIFNQNAYLTFEHINSWKWSNPYYLKELLGVMVVSEDSEAYLKYCFPKQIISRIRLGINSTVFHPQDNKKRQILYMTRKLGNDVKQVVEILGTRRILKNWKLIPINNRKESEVATLMNESLIFLSFSNREGFGLPPAEAMASGCVVIGYPGGSGKEFLKENISFPIEDGNIIQFVKTVESVVAQFHSNPSSITEIGRQAAMFVADKYSMKNEERDILNFWGKTLDVRSI